METYPTILRGRRTTATYKDRSDICIICKKIGGAHYTSEGISYCYHSLDRTRYRDNPKYQTYFSYSAIEEDNPNLTFKRRHCNGRQKNKNNKVSL